MHIENARISSIQK